MLVHVQECKKVIVAYLRNNTDTAALCCCRQRILFPRHLTCKITTSSIQLQLAQDEVNIPSLVAVETPDREKGTQESANKHDISLPPPLPWLSIATFLEA